MKHFTFLIGILSLALSVGGLERLPTGSLDVYFIESEGNKSCRLTQYNVTEQRLESMSMIAYKNESDLIEKVGRTHPDLRENGILVFDQKVQLVEGFNLKQQMIRTNVEALDINLCAAHSSRSKNNVVTVEADKAFYTTPFFIYRSDVVVQGKALAGVLFKEERRSMRQKGREPFFITYVSLEGEATRSSLRELEARKDPLIKKIGSLVTELSMLSRGYNHIIACEKDEVLYNIFRDSSKRNLYEESHTYYITTSLCSSKAITAKKIAQDSLKQKQVIDLINSMEVIDLLRDEISELRHSIFENPHIALLFAHRTTAVGESQSYIQTTEAWKLAATLERLPNLYQLQEEGKFTDAEVASFKAYLNDQEEEIKNWEQKWQQPLTDESMVEEESDEQVSSSRSSSPSSSSSVISESSLSEKQEN